MQRRDEPAVEDQVRDVNWILQKLDMFLGAVIIAVAGIAASQAQALVTQYVLRLGSHLAEAQAHLNNVQTGLRYQLMNETVRQELEVAARSRAGELQQAYSAIADTNLVIRPFSFLRHSDATMLATTRSEFVPALPTSVEAIVYVIVAMIVAFLLYELVKLPITALLLEPRRRKFRRRG